jgi:hypothetical protein
MSTTFREDMQRKVDTIWRFVVWIVAYMISLALCLPGIFISIQYANDACVKGSGTINIALDAWLFVACLFVQVYMLVILLFICLNAKDKTFRVFWIFIHVLQFGWYVIGIYLIINSTLDCKHNSLWQMSIAYCAIMGGAWLLETLWMSLKWSGCTERCSLCNNCFSSAEETYYFIHPITNSPSTNTIIGTNTSPSSAYAQAERYGQNDFLNDIERQNEIETYLDDGQYFE